MADISAAPRPQAQAQAATAPAPNFLRSLGALFGNSSDMAVAGGVLVVVIMLVIPLPTVLLDALMAMNLVLSLLVLLIVLYTKKPTDFSIFPTLTLVLTVFGLALNVSSTRLILTLGGAFDGRMVRAFSTFVVGAGGTQGLVIGFIIFIVLIAVQMIVITKGATRIAEVAARFALDAMPSKQMAVESEFNAGAITEEEAQERKADIMREANFYGAMDGASKFISGNVKVGIFITVINLLGGIIIGVTIHGEDITSAMSTYTSFTIGDGLLSQFPALLISTATGIIVTRSVSVGTFSQDITTQFGRDARIYLIGAITLALFALIPGFPWYVLIPLAGLLGFMAYRIDRSAKKKPVFAPGAKAGGGAAPKKAGEEGEMAPIAPLDPLSLELGYGLIPLVDKEKGAELLERVHRIRRESALDLGLVIPRIRIIDNMRLEPLEYCFKIRGMDVGRGKIRMGSYLCLSPGNGNIDIPGEKTRDPTFGLPAVWITSDRREEAERAGYTVIDPPSIIATHLTEIIKRHAAEIVGRQETQAILDNVQKDYPALVDEAKKSLSLGDIEKVFQGLLREQVSIRNTVAILESLADYGPAAKAMLSGVGNLAGYLTEKARQSLGRQLCLQYSDDDRVMRVLTLDPALEKAIVESKVDTAGGAIAALEPKMQRAWIAALGRQASFMAGQGWPLLVLCSEGARRLVKQSTERELPGLAVLSVPEIVSDVQVEQVGQIKIEG